VWLDCVVLPSPAISQALCLWSGGWQIRDVPTPHLIRSCWPEPSHGPGFLRWPRSTAPVDLAMITEHLVKASF
jgi:hypothetical protein